MLPNIFVTLENLSSLVGVSDNRTLQRVNRLQELLGDAGIREQFDELLGSFGTKASPLQWAREVAESHKDGVRVLSAGALFGGLIAKPCLTVLGERALSGDLASQFALREILDNRVIYPGSFDPMTLGHRDLAERAARVFDEVIIAVGVNSDKRSFLSVEERVALVKEEVKSIPGTFIVMSFEGLLATFAARMNTGVIIRGVRGVTDLEVEKTIGEANKRQVDDGLDLDTFFIPTRPIYENTSSTVVRELARLGGKFSLFVTPNVEQIVKDKVKDEAFARFAATLEYKRLEGYWQRYIGNGQDGVQAKSNLFKELMREYTTPGRLYHNHHHLLDLFDRFDEVAGKLLNPQSVVAAIFLHDVVYDTTQKDNEERSAQWGRDRGRAFSVNKKFHAAVNAHILASKDHLPHPEFPDTAYFIDMDLSILGSSSERYLEYSGQIRGEYQWVGDEVYRKGRAAVLADFLGRDKLFLTEWGSERFGEQAKRNLSAELSSL